MNKKKDKTTYEAVNDSVTKREPDVTDTIPVIDYIDSMVLREKLQEAFSLMSKYGFSDGLYLSWLGLLMQMVYQQECFFMPVQRHSGSYIPKDLGKLFDEDEFYSLKGSKFVLMKDDLDRILFPVYTDLNTLQKCFPNCDSVSIRLTSVYTEMQYHEIDRIHIFGEDTYVILSAKEIKRIFDFLQYHENIFGVIHS